MQNRKQSVLKQVSGTPSGTAIKQQKDPQNMIDEKHLVREMILIFKSTTQKKQIKKFHKLSNPISLDISNFLFIM